MIEAYLRFACACVGLFVLGYMFGQLRNESRMWHLWKEADRARNEWFQKYVDAAEELRDLKRGQTEAESVTADLFRDVLTRMKAAVSSCPANPDNSPTAEECSAVGEIADDLFPLPKTLRGE